MNAGTRKRGKLWVKVTAFVCIVLSAMIFASSALAAVVLYYSDAYYLDNDSIISDYILNETELKKNLSTVYLSYYEPFGYSAEPLEDVVFYDSYDYITITDDSTLAYSPFLDDELVEYYAINYEEFESISPLFGFCYDEDGTTTEWLREIFSVSYSDIFVTEDDLSDYGSYIEIYYPEGRTNFRIDVSNAYGETLYANYSSADDGIELTSSSEDYTVTVMGEPMVIEIISIDYDEATTCVSMLSQLDDLLEVLGFEISITEDEETGEIVYCTHIALSQILSETLTVTASLPSSLEDFNVHDDVYIEFTRINLLLSSKYAVIVAMIATVIIALVCFIVLMTTAGHFPDYEDIHLVFADKIPLELYLIPAGGVILGALIIVSDNIYIESLDTRVLMYLVFSLCAGISVAAVMLVLMTCSARIKARRFLRNTIIFGSLIWLSGFLRKMFANRKYATKLKFVFIGVVIYDILCVLAIFVDAFLGLLCLILGNLAVLIAMLVYAMGVRKLEEAARDISEGKTETIVDNDGLYFGLGRFSGYLNSINDGIQTAVDESLRSERLKTELITNVSHDLKTPLTSIVNYVDILSKEDIQPESAKEYVDVLVRQSQRMKKLIDDLVEASKAQAGAIPVALERTDMSILLTQAVAEYEERLEAQDLKLMVTTPDKPLMAMVDGRLIWRVFDNLMGNILKYAQPATRVYVSAEEADGKILITFKNISKYELNISSDELMERFVRGDSSRSTEGSGLGLSIAKSLCDLNNVEFNIIIDGDLYKAELSMDELPPEPEPPEEETLPEVIITE